MAQIQGKQVANIFNASIAGSAAIATTKLADGANFIQRNGSVAFTADQPHGGFKITGLAAGVAATDAVNFSQLSAITGGLSWKQAVRAATTGNITLSAPQTIDTVSVVAEDRVLVKDQTTASQNGIYIVKAGPWVRATDMDVAAEFDGSSVMVQEGGQQSTAWVETDTVVTVGIDDVNFVQWDSAVITAGSGLTRSTNTLNVNAGDGIDGTFPSNTVAVKVSDFAGTGLQDDGSNNLRLTTQGNGIAGGAGTALSVLANGTSVNVSGSGVKAAVPVTSNKGAAASVTTADFQTTGVAIASTPGGAGMVDVSVNGVLVELGQGVKTKDCYFSGDGGTTARAISAIVATDTLFWVGSVAGYELAVTDKISLTYTVA